MYNVSGHHSFIFLTYTIVKSLALVTVILVAAGSSTTPKLVIFKTSTFQQLQCLLHQNLLIFPQHCVSLLVTC